MIMSKILKKIKRALPDSKCGIEYLSAYTSIRVGGKALIVYPRSIGDIVKIVDICESRDTKYIVLGNGTNILASDGPCDSVIISLKHFVGCSKQGETITVLSGTPLSSVCRFALANNLSGMENLYGIPGTIGGAVYMNAGAYGTSMSDIVDNVTYYFDGQIRYFCVKDLEFDYRHSVFQDLSGAIILSVTCTLASGEHDTIEQKMQEIISLRASSQPNLASAGSVFKRSSAGPVSKMIDSLGLKGKRIGDAEVSTKHAGFIVNCGHASCQDVTKLIKYLKDEVRAHYNVDIECEIIMI